MSTRGDMQKHDSTNHTSIDILCVPLANELSAKDQPFMGIKSVMCRKARDKVGDKIPLLHLGTHS